MAEEIDPMDLIQRFGRIKEPFKRERNNARVSPSKSVGPMNKEDNLSRISFEERQGAGPKLDGIINQKREIIAQRSFGKTMPMQPKSLGG